MGFWSNVEKTSTCWLWNGWTNKQGYGQWLVRGKPQSAHRVSYQRRVGPIPSGMSIDHICRVRRCVNPDHMRVVTHKENVLAGIGPSAVNARKKKCKRGHRLSGDNVYRYKDGRRECIQCRNARQKKHYEENKDDYLAASRRWHEEHRDEHLESMRDYYAANREKIRAQQNAARRSS